jgi:hypothetical protein
MEQSTGLQFPFKLHCMLDDACTNGFDDIVSWDDGDSFKVHNKETFLEMIVPKYFTLTKYRSFQRMLNMWGFQRVRSGPNKGAYAHQHFRRGEPTLCNQMKCQKVKAKTTTKELSSSAVEKKIKRSIRKPRTKKKPSSLATRQKENDPPTVVSLEDRIIKQESRLDNFLQNKIDDLPLMEGQTVFLQSNWLPSNSGSEQPNDDFAFSLSDDEFIF